MSTQSPDALRKMIISLRQLGDVERARGQLDAATARYEQVLEIAHKVLALTGETPPTLRDFAISLCQLGDVENARGRLDAATARYEQGLKSFRKVLALTGEAPEALRDLSITLERLGDVERACSHFGAATAYLVEKLEIARKVRVLNGDTPEALRDLGVSLGLLGGVLFARGQLDGAAVCYEQRLETARKVLAQTGETAQALRDVGISLGRLAGVERARDQLKAATARHEQQLEIYRKVLVLTGENPQALSDLGCSLYCLGDVLYEHGQPDAAIARCDQGIKIDLKVLALTGETAQGLRHLSIRLGTLGRWERARGRLHAAAARYAQKVEIDRRVLALTGETPESLRDLCGSLEMLGNVEQARGQLDAAVTRYEQKLDMHRRELALTAETPKALNDLCDSLGFLSAVELARGNLDAAAGHNVQRLQFNLKLRELTGETRWTLSDRSSVLKQLGDVDRARGQLDAAMARYEQTLEIDRKVVALSFEAPWALHALGVSLGRLGDVECARSQLGAATAWYAQKLEIDRKVLALTGEAPEALRALRGSLQRLGDMERARKRWPEALALYLQLTSVLYRVNPELATWPGDALASASRLASAVRSGALPVAVALPHRTRLWACLAEHLDLNDLEVVERAQADVARFHALWLQLALERAPDRIPEVLGAMQGRKIAALVLEELEQQHGSCGQGGNAALLQRYLALRSELRRLALGLRVVSGGLGGRGATREDPDVVRQSGPSDKDAVPFNADVWRARQAEYQAALAEYRRCRAELAREPGFEALAVPQMDTTDLQAGLAEGHALLILVQPDASPSSARVQAHAFVLTRGGHQSQPLPDLGRAVVVLRDLGRHEAAIAGKRYAAWRDAGPAGAAQMLEQIDAPLLAPDLGQALWTPLAPHLRGIHTLHVVTHGELHLLALQDDTPAGLQVCHYPGLVFYWLQRRRAAAAEPATPPTAPSDVGAQPAMALQAHSPADGEDLPPIPFVHAEARALQALWQQVQPIELDRPLPVELLHLAGHGQAGQGQDAGVLVGPGQTLGLHEVLRSGLEANIVYLSACLVGRTSEDLDGDPLGMLSALFLRGARQIVAPLVPVSDFDAPLLAILFHLALKAQPSGRLDAHQALHEAKAQLRNGEWPAPAEDLVRQAYLPTVQQAIEDVLAQGATGALDPPNEVGRLMAQWLEPACDFLDVQAAEDGPVAAVFARGGGAEAGAQAALDLLVSNRHRLHLQPGVQALLRYVGVFGASGSAR